MNAFVPRSQKDIGPTSNGVTLFSYILDLEAKLQSLIHATVPEDGTQNLQKIFGLTAKEAQLLQLLADGRTRSKEQILDGLYWSSTDDAPEIKIIDVFVCKVRKKIAGSGVEIETVWGSGYFVVGTEVLKAAMAGVAPMWAANAPQPFIGKPDGAKGRPKNSVRDAALSLLRQEADAKRRVTITSRELSTKARTGNAGSVTIRNLEKRGYLKVITAPPASGRYSGGPWVLELAA